MRFVVVLVQSLYLFNEISSIQSDCPEESYSGVTWSSNNQQSEDPISSDPMCLDENKFTIYRRCIDQEWSPKTPPNCAYHQKNREERLPAGFVDVTSSSGTSIYRTEPQPWSDSCAIFSSFPSLATYYSLLSPSNDFFWLPVRRPRNYYPFILTYGVLYGKITDEYNHIVDAHDCLISNFDGSIVQSANCSDHYPEICINYPTLPDLYQQFCESGEFTPLTFPTANCYRVVYSSDHNICENYFRIKSWNEDQLLTSILQYDEDDCRIQIDPFDGQDQFDLEKWQINIDNTTFANWDVDVRDGELSGFMTAGPSGRWKLADSYECAICERSMETTKIPQLILNFNSVENRLELVVFNHEFGLSTTLTCYTTNGDSLLLKESTSLISKDTVEIPDLISSENSGQFITKAVYRVVITNIYPGEFWCSVRSFPGYQTIISNIIVTEWLNPIDQVIFGLYVNSSFFCNFEYCINEKPLTNLEISSSGLKTKLQNVNPLIDFGDVRAMEILDTFLDEVEILFHVTISLDQELVPDPLNLFQFRASEEIHFNQMNFIHFIINDMILFLIHIPKSKLFPVFYCVAEIEDDSGDPRLISARIGEKAVIPKLCLNDDFVLNYWECIGKFPFGARWSSTVERPCETEHIPQHTQELFNLAGKSNLTLEDMHHIEKLTSENLLNPTDMFLVGISLQKFSATGLDEIQFAHEIQVIPNILSNVLEVSERVAHLGNMHLNASNIILSSYEEIFSYTATHFDIIYEDSFYESGVVEFNSSNVLTFIIDPLVLNISGVGLFRKDRFDSNQTPLYFDFTDIDIRYLFANESISDLLEDKLLDNAMLFPEPLLNSIKESHQPLTENSTEIPLRIIFTIMKNDVLFQPTTQKNNNVSVGRVLMASIPQLHVEFQSLFLYFLKIDRNPTPKDEFKCGFWKIHSGSGNESEWSDEGCFFIGMSHNTTNPVAICGCTHLTSFAFLITGESEHLNAESLSHHAKALDLITITGCSLSLAGIILIWITALVFKSWRHKKGTKVLLHLSLGIALQNVLILIPNFKAIPISQRLPCIVFGVCLHYSVLVVFAWMLIVAYFQYLRFVRVFQSDTTRIILKCCVVGWIAPLLPIVVILSINFNLYIPHNFISDAALCYPQGEAFIYGLILPVSFIIIINLFVFGMVLYSITCGSQNTRNGSRFNQIHLDQLRLVVFLFFLLGFNWMFGIFINVDRKSLVLSYLFCITASLQGLTLFVYFVMMDPNTRSLWINFRKYKNIGRSN